MKSITFVPKVVKRAIENMFFEILQYSQENHFIGVSLLIKIHQTFRPATLLKADSNTSVCLTIFKNTFLKNICEQLFLRVFPFILFSFLNK